MQCNSQLTDDDKKPRKNQVLGYDPWGDLESYKAELWR